MAAQWLQTVDEASLVHCLKVYGEERYAKRIARAILGATHPWSIVERYGRLRP